MKNLFKHILLPILLAATMSIVPSLATAYDNQSTYTATSGIQSDTYAKADYTGNASFINENSEVNYSCGATCHSDENLNTGSMGSAFISNGLYGQLGVDSDGLQSSTWPLPPLAPASFYGSNDKYPQLSLRF